MIKFENTGSEFTLRMHGAIGESGWTLDRFINELSNVSAPKLTIEIKSNGGDVFEAFAIFDELRKMATTKVVAKIVGTSASAATIIASAADTIEITENSRYLVHFAQTGVQGNKQDLLDRYEELVKIDESILAIYQKRTGRSREELSELMQKDKYLTAQEALDWGFVNKIIKDEKQNKVTNQITNTMTEEEILKLKEENEALKAQIAAMMEEVEALRAEKAAKEDEELEAEVQAHITAGKFTAEVAGFWKTALKTNKVEAHKAINAIRVEPKKLADVPATTTDPAITGVYTNKADAWEAFKTGKITNVKYAEIVKNLK